MKCLSVCLFLSAVAFAALPAHAERMCLEAQGASGLDVKVVDGKTLQLQAKGSTTGPVLMVTTSCAHLSEGDAIRLNGSGNCVQSDEFLASKPKEGRGEVCQVLSIRRQDAAAK